MHNRTFFSMMLLLSALFVFTITTTARTACDTPQVQVAWVTYTEDIAIYDGHTVTRIAGDEGSLANPYVFGEQIVWERRPNRLHPNLPHELMLWDGNSVTQLTDNDWRDFNPMMSGEQVIWYADTAGVQIYDSEAITTLSASETDIGWQPRLSGDYAVWSARPDADTPPEIYVWDGNHVIQLTDNNYADEMPRLAGNRIVWQATTADDIRHIMFWDGSTGETVVLDSFDISMVGNTPQRTVVGYPHVSETVVVWNRIGEDGNMNVRNLFMWDGETVTQITDNDAVNVVRDISNEQFVWSASNLADGRRFLLWDGEGAIEFAPASTTVGNPSIDAGHVVWAQRHSRDTTDIFLYHDNTTLQLTTAEFEGKRHSPHISVTVPDDCSA
ncbi:MAG: hypothetical protein AAFV98_06855 [Chloroflexota bacterium]